MLICFFTRHLEVILKIHLLLSPLLTNIGFYLKCHFISCLSSKLLHILEDPDELSPWGTFGDILCAVRAGTIFFCGTLHIPLRVCIVARTSFYYGTDYIPTVTLTAMMILGDCWELSFHTGTVPGASGVLPH